MKYCEGCGARVDNEAVYCSVCGAKMKASSSEKKTQAQTKIEDAFNRFTNTSNTTADYSPEDIAKNRPITFLAYLGALCFIPLFIAKDSPYARFHTNQGLILFLFGLITSVAGLIPYVGWIIAAVISIFDTLLLVVGILNAFRGEAKELPLIGKFRILR